MRPAFGSSMKETYMCRTTPVALACFTPQFCAAQQNVSRMHWYGVASVRLVGLITLQVFFAKEPYKRDNIQKVSRMRWYGVDSVTARSVEDETRNDRRNANRNPEW